MPFIKRVIEPQHLSNSPLPPGCDRELDTVSNNTLCGLVRQLSDLSLRANDIFSDISSEAHLLAHRTLLLRRRTIRLEDLVEKLDARSVRVPVSSLEEFKNTTDHYKASQNVDEDLFVQDTRPGCLTAVYDRASTDLKDIYAKFKEYHEDEVTVISMQASSLLAAEYKAQSEYNIVFPRRDIILPSPDQKIENLPNPKRTQRPLSDGDILSESYLQRLQSPLPTPEEAVRQHVGPSSMVTVDTSGSGFERMANIRRSLTLTFRMSSRGRKERREKKAWRRTVSGIPREVEEELKMGRARSNSGSEYTSSSSADFEEIRTQSLDRKLKYSVREYNKAYEARKAAGKVGKPSIAVVAPLRNRRRNRHSLGDSSKLEKALNLNGSASLPRGMGLLRPNSVPPGSAMGTVQFSGSSADSSMERIWQTAAVNRLNEHAESRKHPSGHYRNGKPKLFLPQMSHLPNAVISTQSYLNPISTDTTVTSKGDIQHPKPHQQHLRPDPAELAASVRLRMQKSSIRKEDRRSSSGNWSGTDSTRTSVCSEQDSQVTPPANMDASPSDSAVSLSNEIECSQGTPIAPCANASFPGLINGDGSRPCFLPVQKSSHSSSSGSPTPTNELEAAGGTFTRLDTETWLKSVGASQGSAASASIHSKPELGNTAPSVKGPLKPQLSFGDSSSESSVENAASIVSDNTSLDLDAYFGDSAEEFPDTDSLSAFSVDQEGYWTSMHSDCGLSPKHAKHPTIPEHPQSVGYDYDIAAHYKGKDSRRGFITPKNKVSKDSNQQAPVLPKRDDSFSLDAHLSNLQLQPHLDGSPISMDSSSPSNQTLTNDSDGSRSVTPAPSDMSDVSSASYDLPPPLCSPNDPKMYNICYGGVSKTGGIPGGPPSTSSRQTPISALSMATNISSNGLQYTQSLINGVGRSTEASTAATSSQSMSGQNMGSLGLQNHFPIASSATSSGSQASDFWATPIPGAMMKARERFYGYKPSPKPEQQTSQTMTESDTDTVTPVTSPRTPTDSNNTFFGMYPGSYNVIRKKSKDSTYTVYSNGMSASLINKPADVISPTNSLDRKQKFNRYVSDLQVQAPQAYDALSQLKAGEERTKAMSREQRAEILEQMRKSKSGGRNSSMATPPATPTSPPVIPTTTNVSAMLAMSCASESPLNKEEARTTSFRTSYKEGIAAQNLDPDKAIIQAAKKMEDNRIEPDTEQGEVEHTDGSAESDDIAGRPTTPKSVTLDAVEELEEHTPYVFDPKRQPGSSILKGSNKKDNQHAKIHKSKKKLNISTDPFADTTIGQMMAADSPYDNVPSNSRTIRFSETVSVENTPVRVCLVSGKPRTNMTDFKALLQQQSTPIGSRTVSACYALNVRSSVKGPRNAELLYRGILQEEDEAKKAEDDRQSTESPVPERKIVTVSDLKNAMASARGNVRMVNVEEAREKHEIVNKSSCATVTAIPEMSSLPIRETVINGADDSPESDAKNTEETDANHPPVTSSLDTGADDHCKNGCEVRGSPETLSSNNNNNHREEDSINSAPMVGVPSTDSPKYKPTSDTAKVNPTSATLVESTKKPDEDSTVRRIPKHSWSDTDLNRTDLMAAIRDRGKQGDKRESAVARLEEARDVGKKGSPARRAMTVSRSEGSIHSILDSVKHSIQKMSPKHEAHDGPDMDYAPDAWD